MNRKKLFALHVGLLFLFNTTSVLAFTGPTMEADVGSGKAPQVTQTKPKQETTKPKQEEKKDETSKSNQEEKKEETKPKQEEKKTDKNEDEKESDKKEKENKQGIVNKSEDKKDTNKSEEKKDVKKGKISKHHVLPYGPNPLSIIDSTDNTTLEFNDTLNSDKPKEVKKEGTQKVLLLLVESVSTPFKQDATHYNELFFGNSDNSLKTWVDKQSNGKFKLEPMKTNKTKHNGIVELSIDEKDFKRIKHKDYAMHKDLAGDIISSAKDFIDFESADLNKDKKFLDAWNTDNGSIQEELAIHIILSGDTKERWSKGKHIQAWPHLTHINREVNGFEFNTSAVITSETLDNNLVGLGIHAHEYIHSLSGKDLCNKDNSVGFWSVMGTNRGSINDKELGYDVTTLDPIHKIMFGWNEIDNLDLSKQEGAYAFENNKSLLINLPNSSAYILEYRDKNNIYEKVNQSHDVNDSGVVIWKVNKDNFLDDWFDGDWILGKRKKQPTVSIVGKTGSSISSKNNLFVKDDEIKFEDIKGLTLKVVDNGIKIIENTIDKENLVETKKDTLEDSNKDSLKLNNINLPNEDVVNEVE